MTLRCAVCFALFAALPHAATLRGMVVERQTGKPLARALVAVHPVAGTAGATQSVRTDAYGRFEFPSIAAGAYVVSSARKGFAPVQYGQRDWKAPGAPVSVPEGDPTVLRIALPRYGAITGRVSDEADVGLVEHEVVAYRNSRPPVVVARAATDDRGMFRIFGLTPGAYLVRTAPKQYDDNGYLPTFFKETPQVDRATAVDVEIDHDTPDVNVRPIPGRLFEISGQVSGPGTPPGTWTVSLISDMGFETTTTDQAGGYHFGAVAPGRYDLLAESPRGAGWLSMDIDRTRTDTRLPAYPVPTVDFVFTDANGATVDPAALQLLARRRELWGPTPVEYLQITQNRARLIPGRWEFSLAPNASYYARGWRESVITYSSPGPVVRFIVSPNPAAVHGSVTDAAGGPAAGAPVYLQGGGETRNTRTDIHGAYFFRGLPPGEYRVLSTFESQTDAGGQAVKVEEGQDLSLDLKVGSAL